MKKDDFNKDGTYPACVRKIEIHGASDGQYPITTQAISSALAQVDQGKQPKAMNLGTLLGHYETDGNCIHVRFKKANKDGNTKRRVSIHFAEGKMFSPDQMEMLMRAVNSQKLPSPKQQRQPQT